MAKVKIEQRCNGPFQWGTVGAERKPVPQGLCGTLVAIEYDDRDPYSTRIGELIAKVGLKCEPCSKQGKEMRRKADALRQRKLDEAKKGKSFSSEEGKEHMF